MTTTKRLLFINRVYPPHQGATGIMLSGLTAFLKGKGYQITVLTLGPKADDHLVDGIRVIRIAHSQSDLRSLKSNFSQLRTLANAALDQKVTGPQNVLITMTDPPLLQIWGARIARKRNLKHIHWSQDLYPHIAERFMPGTPQILLKYAHRANHKALKKCDQIVTIANDMKDVLGKYTINQNTIHVIENWPSNASIQKPPTDNPLLAENKFRLLLAGNTGRTHPIDGLLGAMRILSESNPEIELLMNGGGENYEEMAKQRDVQSLNNIRFLPYQKPEDVSAMMHSGDIHIVLMDNASAGLYLPSKFYAALATGRPVLFLGPGDSDIGRLLKETKAGTRINPHESEKIARAILAYRKSATHWHEAAQAALTLSANYTIEKAGAKWLKVLENLG